MGPAGERRETLAAPAALPCTFRVPLTGVESIEVTGAVPDAASSFDLFGFAENVRRTFPGQRAAAQPEITMAAKS